MKLNLETLNEFFLRIRIENGYSRRALSMNNYYVEDLSGFALLSYIK